MQRLIQIIWGVGLFMLPFNLGLLLWQDPQALENQFNPYTSVTLLVSEGLILIAVALALTQRPFKNPMFSFVVMGLIALSTIFSENAAGIMIASLHALTFLALLYGIQEALLPIPVVCRILMSTLMIQVLLGLAQVGLQHSLGLSLLGESTFTAQTAGVAKTELFGQTWVRAQGTFPHANVLSGALVIGFFLAAREPVRSLKYGLGALFVVGILATASQGAWVGLGLGASLLAGAPTSLMLGVFILIAALAVGLGIWGSSESLQERIELIRISVTMLVKHPFGVGWHQFTTAMQTVSEMKLQPWQLQPVHNLYLLVLNELGVQLLLVTKWVFKKIHNRAHDRWALGLLVSVGVMGWFDHYWWSLPQGLMLLGLVVGLTAKLSPAPRQ